MSNDPPDEARPAASTDDLQRPEPPATATLGPLARRRADGFALVLASEGIDHRLLAGTDGTYLAVAATDAARATASLGAYMAENDAPVFGSDGPRLRVAAIPGDRTDVAVGITAALALLIGFRVAGDAAMGGGLAGAGAADSGLILNGEVWRTVTALTLHAGLGHVLANAMASIIFLPFAARRFGGGLAVLGTMAAGAVGNGLTALIRGPGSAGVGFSTAVFGMVGLLAGARLVTGGAKGRRGGWLALGAAVAILALLGAGEQTDVLAHFCGLAAGVPIGALLVRWAGEAGGAGRSPGTLRRWPAQAAALALASGVVWAAWALALR